jgi:hypothetical protein
MVDLYYYYSLIMYNMNWEGTRGGGAGIRNLPFDNAPHKTYLWIALIGFIN